MATDADRITVPGRARVFLAIPGTAAPADESAALDPGWVEVGYTTVDGTSFTTDPSFEVVRSHQADNPTRRFQTEDNQAVEADLQEWSGDNFAAVFGGGEVTVVTAGHYRYDPPAIGGRISVAALLEVVDGSKRYRFVVPKASQSDGVELGLDKGSESTLPLRLAVEGTDGVLPWYLLTNDPAFAAIAISA